jgi:hypothetical protein
MIRRLLGLIDRELNQLGQHLVHILLAFAGNREGDVATGPISGPFSFALEASLMPKSCGS